MDFTKLATPEIIQKTIAALLKNGIDAEIVATGKEAAEKVLSLIPLGAEVMTMTSVTLEQLGLLDVIDNSGKYNSVKAKLMTMERQTQNLEMQKIGSGSEWSLGSVHAVTEDGKVFVASNTGSQLPGYVYGSPHVIWVVGTKKIVQDANQAMERIQEYIIPKESNRARAAYGLPDSFNTYVSKLLIFNREINPNRIKLIFVNEDLGF